MLEKIKTLKSIETNIVSNSINVCWIMQIVEDGQTLSENEYRTAYDKFQKDKFIKEVENADLYIHLIDWEDKQESCDPFGNVVIQ